MENIGYTKYDNIPYSRGSVNIGFNKVTNIFTLPRPYTSQTAFGLSNKSTPLHSILVCAVNLLVPSLSESPFIISHHHPKSFPCGLFSFRFTLLSTWTSVALLPPGDWAATSNSWPWRYLLYLQINFMMHPPYFSVMLSSPGENHPLWIVR